MKTCPFCKEEIQDTAKKCRYCGEFLGKEINKQETGREEILVYKRRKFNRICRLIIGIFTIILLPSAINKISEKLELHDDYLLIKKRGLLGYKEESIPYKKINNVDIKLNMWGYKTLSIYTGNDKSTKFYEIERADEVVENIRKKLA